MDSETVTGDESDLMSVISETTVGSINSPIILNLLSRFKEPDTRDSINRNSAVSPSIPDQNFNLTNLDTNFYKEAVGNLTSEDENSQSLLSERYGSGELRSRKKENIACENLSGFQYNHSSQLRKEHSPKESNINEQTTSLDDNEVVNPKVENIHYLEVSNQIIENKAVEDTLAAILTSLECDSVPLTDQLTPDQEPGASISRVKTRQIQLSPFTGFDSEIYPESVQYEAHCTTNSLIKTKEKISPDVLNIGNIHKAVQDDNTQSSSYDDNDQLESFERGSSTNIVCEKYVNAKRNSLIASPVLQDIVSDDETQAPISGDQSLGLNISMDLNKGISLHPTNSYDEPNDEHFISEELNLNTPKKKDLPREQDHQTSSPQLSVYSDQSTEICRLDLRGDTMDISCSQSNCIPIDVISTVVTDGGDPDTTNHCSNNCSIETVRSTSLEHLDKETKLQDPLDRSTNLDNVSNIQLDNCKESFTHQSNNDLSNHENIIEDKDDPAVRSLDTISPINEFPSSPTMSCISESILCKKKDAEVHKSEIVQTQDLGILSKPIDKPFMLADEDQSAMDEDEDMPDMVEDDIKRKSINEENIFVKSEKNSMERRPSQLDYNQANDVKQTSVVTGSCVEVSSLTKELSNQDDNQQSNNKFEKLVSKERAMIIGGDSGKLSGEAKEETWDPKSKKKNIGEISDIINSKILASPAELKAQDCTKALNMPNQKLLQYEDKIQKTLLTNTNVSSEVSSQVPDNPKTDFTQENLSKYSQDSRISQNVSTCTPKQPIEPIGQLKPMDNITVFDHVLNKSEQLEILNENTQDKHSLSTSSHKSMIYSQNDCKSKSEVQETQCSQQNTPDAAIRRSSRESKQPVRFSSPEQNIKPKVVKPEPPPIAKLNCTNGNKRQKIPITFTNAKKEGREKTQDIDFGDDFEVHQEKLNTYIQMEIKYGQLQDDMKRNPLDRESLKRYSCQFKTLQPQLMKLLSDSKQESQKISSKAREASDKSLMKTRIKLLSIRQKKLKALFDKHCRAQSTLKLIKSKVGTENTTDFTQMDFSQSTTSSKNSRRHTQTTQLTNKMQSKESAELVLNTETGLFESVGQKIPITQRGRPETMAQIVSNVQMQSKSVSAAMNNLVKTTSIHECLRQTNAIKIVSDPRSSDSTGSGKTNPSKHPGYQSQKIVFIPVGKASVGQAQDTTTNTSSFVEEQNKERGNSKKLITQKFVPPTKTVYVRVGNTNEMASTAINKKSSMPIVPNSDMRSSAPQSTCHQVTKSSHDDDEILDIILKSLDKDANESKDHVPVNSSYTDLHSLSPQHQDDSDSNGFVFDNEVVDLTREDAQTNINRVDQRTNFTRTEPNQELKVQQRRVKAVSNTIVNPLASENNGPEDMCLPTIKSSLTKAVPAKQSPFHSPCRSVMSFRSSFSTSSTRYVMKMKEKALKITHAKTARDFQTSIGNVRDTKKYKKFPSLKRMIDRGLLKPGKDKLSINCKGQRVTASLLDSGMILDANGQGFSTATKWFSDVTGTQLTMKAKAYRMVCYENTPLMEFKKQYDKLESKNFSSQIPLTTDIRKQSKEANSVSVATSSMQSVSYTASVFTSMDPTTAAGTRSVTGTSTITTAPQIKTSFQTRTNTATMPVGYRMIIPHPNPQYRHQILNQVRYPIRARFTTPESVSRNIIRVTNLEPPLSRSLIGNQPIFDQKNRSIQGTNLSTDHSKTADYVSMIPPIDPRSLLNDEIRSMLMKSVNVLLVSDSELMHHQDITEDFWVKPFKDVDISKELWKEVDAW